MENPSRANEAQRESPECKTDKKPYRKPAIIYRAPLEAMAAVCRRPLGKSPVLGCGVRFS